MRHVAIRLLATALAGLMSRQQQEIIEFLREENRVLRAQIGKRRLRLTDDQRRRLAAKGKSIGRKILDDVCSIVSPETILRWHRRLIAKKYDGHSRRRPGPVGVMANLRALVVRMATENPSWGYSRIQGALSNIGHQVGRSTIRRVLKENGLEPADQRSRKTPWATFLRAHWPAIAATDMFNVEVWTPRGLARFWVFFVIDLASRRVEIAGMTPAPDESWVLQLSRNLTDPFHGFLRNHRFLIHDRDPLFTATFARALRASGVRPIRLPPRSPNLNAFAERFVRSIKEECLSRLIPLGERHLRMAIEEYAEHYNVERNHQGIGNRLIEGNLPKGEGEVRCRERLGGMLRFYQREAA